MSKQKQCNWRADEELLASLEYVKERDGISITEQLRRATRLWLEQKGVEVTQRTEANGK
jgi:hypothetical protein